MHIFKIQPSAHTDHITEDGTELTKLPYPFFADDKGMVQRQDFWQGKVVRIVGFQKDLAVQQLDLSWLRAQQDLSQAVGMYVISTDSDGGMGVHPVAVESVEEVTL
jgi:hypothetical protein